MTSVEQSSVTMVKYHGQFKLSAVGRGERSGWGVGVGEKGAGCREIKTLQSTLMPFDLDARSITESMDNK